MARFKTAEIKAFFKNPIWGEIKARTESELKRVDSSITNRDPYEHGVAVGERAVLRTYINYEAILLTEAEGKSPYGNEEHI